MFMWQVDRKEGKEDGRKEKREGGINIETKEQIKREKLPNLFT